MSRKFDQPFVEISCWVPLSWSSLHPAIVLAVLQQLAHDANTEGDTDE